MSPAIADAPTERPIAAFSSLPRRKKWWPMVFLGCMACLLWEIYQVFLGSNIHVVEAGRVYRGAQQDPADLEKVVKKYGIRTVVNLRGLGNPVPWYLDQCRMIQRLGINQEDLCFSAGRMPPAQELRRLVEILDEAEYPIFFHCRRGADRTGVACAVTKLLQPETSYEEARQQLGWRYGHVALGRPAYLDQFLELYEDWLREQQKTHTSSEFRHWVLNEYRGGWCNYLVLEFCSLTPEKDGEQPHSKPAGEPIGYRVRLRNTGVKPWFFNPHFRSGFHLVFRVRDNVGKIVLEGKSGLRVEQVDPGEEFATTLVVPPTLKSGRYRMTVDLCEEYQGWFFQVGAEPMEEELVIRE